MAFRRFCEAAARGAPIELFGDGRQSRDFTLRRRRRRRRSAPPATAPGAGGRAYNVGGGAPVSLNAALEQLAAIAGPPARRPPRASRESGDVLHTAADGSRAREELGFAPATTLRRRACARSTSGCVERAEQGRGLAALRGA